MEKIVIKNFGGLKNAEIILNKVNVFIGKQASGKSVTAKLIYFFREIIPHIVVQSNYFEKTNKEIKDSFTIKFNDYFPPKYCSDKPFEIIHYFNKSDYIKVEKKKSKLAIEYSPTIISFLEKSINLVKERKKHYRHNQTDSYLVAFKAFLHEKSNFPQNIFSNCFVPAGRLFFSHLESTIFSILRNQITNTIDPFILEFGSFYEQIKNSTEEIKSSLKGENNLFNSLIEEILDSQHERENKRDYLKHPDGRKVDLSFASSGQQETLPLLLILKFFGESGEESSVFIEEPEAHLFPAAQKKITELISLVFNRNGENNLQFTITTHSPYILSSFNNLVQASILYNSANTKNKKKINQIIPKELHLNPNCLSAYAFRDGKADSIIDPETQLIYAEYLDSVSEDIGSEFSNLLDLG